jgi:uncharacterized protein (TIGR03083 family)
VTALLSRERIWEAIDAQRLRVADLLDQLTDEEWRQPSLCDGWTVRDVAAHLTLQQLTLRQAMPTVVKYRGNLPRATSEAAREQAQVRSTEQIIAGIRGMVGTRGLNVGVTVREALIDALIHGQDIALPLGRQLEIPPYAAAEATTRMFTMRWPRPFPATRTMKRFRVTASDIDWAAGDGPEVHGPMGAIMLVSSGRLVALPQLSGPGAPALAAALRGA